MAKVIRQTLGVITEVVKAEGAMWPEDDWRNEYVGMPGIIAQCVSVHHSPGAQFIHLEGLFNYMHTSYGEIMDDGMTLVILTHNSRYTFQRFSPWFEREMEDLERADEKDGAAKWFLRE